MATHSLTESCISTERGALVFWSPANGRLKDGVVRSRPRLHERVQIVDVFSLEVATGYCRDPQGKLLLESQPSIAAGRSWTLAKATQLIRHDARPHRWVALQMDNRAWGLFWAGGGLQCCREELAERANDAQSCSALDPATPEALMRLMLDLEQEPSAAPERRPWRKAITPEPAFSPNGPNPWVLVGWTSLVWMAVLSVTVVGFLVTLDRQNQKLDLLLERSEQTSQ